MKVCLIFTTEFMTNQNEIHQICNESVSSPGMGNVVLNLEIGVLSKTLNGRPNFRMGKIILNSF